MSKGKKNNNLLSEKLDNKFRKSYQNNFENIYKNLMVHTSFSVYGSEIIEKRNNLIDDLKNSSKTAVSELNSKMEVIIETMRAKEVLQAEKLEYFCFSRLITEVNDQERKEIIRVHEDFLKTQDFLKKMILLNNIYLKYSLKTLGIALNQNGYYDYTSLFDKEDIKKLMSSIFNEFIRTFTQDEDEKSNLLSVNKRELKDTIESFNKFMEKLLSKQEQAESNNDWEQAGIYESIIRYCNGRGISFIKYFYKELKSFEEAKNKLINSTENERLQNLYYSSTKQTVHKKIRHTKGTNDKTIEGSFYGAIKSPNRGGIILEYLEKGLFLNNNKLKISKNKIQVENTGKNLNILGKSQKNDILVTFGLNLNPSKKFISKDAKSKILTQDNIKSYIGSDPRQIGISIKNYTKDNDVTVHSAGNLSTVSTFLKTYNPIGVEEFCEILDAPLTKYILINDRNKSNLFYNELRLALATQGAIFTLTPFLVKTGKSVVNESVDFFLVDQVLIPGSLIMEFANNATSKSFNTSRARSMTGFYTKINDKNTLTDNDIEKYNSTLPKPTKDNSTKIDRYPYNDIFVNAMGELGEKVFNKISFTIEMRNSFRKNLQNCVSILKGGI